jgi:hypothetical protein
VTFARSNRVVLERGELVGELARHRAEARQQGVAAGVVLRSLVAEPVGRRLWHVELHWHVGRHALQQFEEGRR